MATFSSSQTTFFLWGIYMDHIIESKEYPSTDDAVWDKALPNGDYLTHYLAEQNNDILLDVLKHHESLVLRRSHNGKYVSHILANKGYVSLLLRLLERYPYLTDVLDDENRCHIVHYLVVHPVGLEKVIKKHPQIDLSIVNGAHMTPLMLAIKTKMSRSIDLIVKHPRFKVAQGRISEVCMLLGTYQAKLQDIQQWLEILISKGADLNKISIYGEFPLYIAYQNKQYDTMDFLIEKGANINNGGIGRSFILFRMASRKQWGLLNKYLPHFDFTLRNLRWNDCFQQFLEDHGDSITDDELDVFLPLIPDMNVPNVDGNTVFHMLPPDKILSKHDFFSTRFINISAVNQAGASVLSLWIDHPSFRQLVDIWWKGIQHNRKRFPALYNAIKKHVKKLYSISFLESIEIDESIAIPGEGRTAVRNNIYSAYLDNLIVYITAVIKKHSKLLFVPMKESPLKLTVTGFDSQIARSIKIRLGAKEALSTRLNNFIEFHDTKTFYFPQLPRRFPPDTFTFYMLTIVDIELNHSNIVIIDGINKVIERFDSEGHYVDDVKLDRWLSKRFRSHPDLKDYTYSVTYHPNRNLFQLLETALDDNRPGDPIGFCSAWSLWYLELRLSHPTVLPELLYEKAVKQILSGDMSIRDYIRTYTNSLARYRNSFIKRALQTDAQRNSDYLADEENDIVREKIDKVLLRIQKDILKKIR